MAALVLNGLRRRQNQPVYLGGDTNQPDIDGKSSSISGKRYPLSINNTPIELLQDIGCEQLVTLPKRLKSTLYCYRHLCNEQTIHVNKRIPIPVQGYVTTLAHLQEGMHGRNKQACPIKNDVDKVQSTFVQADHPTTLQKEKRAYKRVRKSDTEVD